MNKNLFDTKTSSVPLTVVKNNAGGAAYNFDTEHTLAQLCMTGTFHNTYYVAASDQLAQVLDLARKCSPEFVAKLAVHARKEGFMKDSPAVLLAHLSTVNTVLFKRVFPLVADNLKMVRNFVNVMRSGTVGRKSLGSAPKKMIQNFLTNTPVGILFRDGVGNDPSLKDLIRMVHPRPKSNVQKNFFAYVLGNEYDESMIDPEILAFEKFKINPVGNPPAVNFQMLSNIRMNQDQWIHLAKEMSWHTLRMNLNTLERNGVFNKGKMIEEIGNRLADEEVIRRVKVFPFQIYNTMRNTTVHSLTGYLSTALNHSLKNVPAFNGRTAVFVDVSGSMGASALGEVSYTRTSAPVSCRNVAGLFAAAIKVKNPSAMIAPFHTSVVADYISKLDRCTSVSEMSRTIDTAPGGGTDCSIGLEYLLNKGDYSFDNVIIISDNESWVGSLDNKSKTWKNWLKYKAKNPNAKLVCMDIAPNRTTQVLDGKDVLNIGGFSDQMFTVIEKFTKNTDAAHWVKTINNTEI